MANSKNLQSNVGEPARSSRDHREEFREAASAVRADVREAGGHIRDMGTAARGMASDELDHLSDEVRILKEKLASRVESKPLQSIAVAAGAGILLGLFLRR